ncbi:hypothetical protein F5B19DRAFT_198041 [Rostrohypoxylon terebratum]|nr:hypothetical protein F5B19DRAFT_198041 [Rostrohypoxylon terebratum]
MQSGTFSTRCFRYSIGASGMVLLWKLCWANHFRTSITYEGGGLCGPVYFTYVIFFYVPNLACCSNLLYIGTSDALMNIG